MNTCVVLDVALNDAAHGVKSAQLPQSKLHAQGLITRNPTDFKSFYPGLNLLGP